MHDFVIHFGEKQDKGLTIVDCANIIIAAVSLLLAFYIFIYQRDKDKKSDYKTAKLNEQNINLQWFKELIIQPHYDLVIETYRNLINYTIDFQSPGDTLYHEKINVYIGFLKDHLFHLRRNFIALFETVDPKLYTQAIAIIDEVIDNITNNILNQDVDLTVRDTYESIILKEIISSKNKMIKLIYTYKAS